MLKLRVIPTMLYSNFTLVKGQRFDGARVVGDPMQAVQVYNLRNVDELCFMDITASAANSGPDFALIDRLSDRCFMPLTVRLASWRKKQPDTAQSPKWSGRLSS